MWDDGTVNVGVAGCAPVPPGTGVVVPDADGCGVFVPPLGGCTDIRDDVRRRRLCADRFAVGDEAGVTDAESNVFAGIST